MADPKAKRAAEIQQSIRDVLMHQWDPIGIADYISTDDEYDAYIAPVYRILVGSRSEDELVSLLHFTERDDITPEALRGVARALLTLDVKL
jgi:hypothetical protein